MRIVWGILGVSSLLLGVVGIVLPLLPTVPFLLLSAFCFARSSERMHDWLMQHERLGPPIRDWQKSGVISLPAKRLATLSIIIVYGISIFMQLRLELLLIQGAVLSAVLLFIWSRPSHPR